MKASRGKAKYEETFGLSVGRPCSSVDASTSSADLSADGLSDGVDSGGAEAS